MGRFLRVYVSSQCNTWITATQAAREAPEIQKYWMLYSSHWLNKLLWVQAQHELSIDIILLDFVFIGTHELLEYLRGDANIERLQKQTSN